MVVRGPLLAASPLSPTLLQQRHILAFACAAGPVSPPPGSPASCAPRPSPARPRSCAHRRPSCAVLLPPRPGPACCVTYSHAGLLGPGAPSSDHHFLRTTGSPTPPLPDHTALMLNPASTLYSPFLAPVAFPWPPVPPVAPAPTSSVFRPSLPPPCPPFHTTRGRLRLPVRTPPPLPSTCASVYLRPPSQSPPPLRGGESRRIFPPTLPVSSAHQGRGEPGHISPIPADGPGSHSTSPCLSLS
jgi:hypothetical protein